jgi:hypothetical protein
MAKSRIRLLSLAAVAITALLSVAAASSPAGAQTRAAVRSDRTEATYTWFWLENDTYGTCVQEDGVTSAVYMGGCGSNHSVLWRWTAAGMLLNGHSGLCITTNGDGSPIMFNCHNYGTQLWKKTEYTTANGNCRRASVCFSLYNASTRGWLADASKILGLDRGSFGRIDNPFWDLNQRPFANT